MIIERDRYVELLHYSWDNFNEELYKKILTAKNKQYAKS